MPHRDPDPRRDLAHLANVRLCCCVVCGKSASQAHHLLRVYDDNGVRIVKSQNQRNDDRWAIPLCVEHHDQQYPDSVHRAGDEEGWLASKGIDGRALARALWAVRGDLDAMQRHAFRFWQGSLCYLRGVLP